MGTPPSTLPTTPSLSSQTLQMGIYHFSGLFVLLCIGLSGSLLTSLGEHVFYRLVLPRIKRKKKFNYWLHTSQVGRGGARPQHLPPALFHLPMGPSPLPCAPQKIHRALNTGVEEQKGQKLSLAER